MISLPQSQFSNSTSHIRNISLFSEGNQKEPAFINKVIDRTIIKSQNKQISKEEEKGKEEIKLTKSPNISLCYEYSPYLEGNKDSYLINMVNFMQNGASHLERNPIFKLIDGIILEVDYLEGISIQAERILRHTLSEKVKLVLMINNIHKYELEAHGNAEFVYQKLAQVIETANITISAYEQPGNNSNLIKPAEGNVMFLLGNEHSWGFTISRFAHIYSKKFGVNAKKLAEKLWGDNYFDIETKSWSTESNTSPDKKLKRGFVRFIMEPIIKLTTFVTNENGLDMDALHGMIKVELSPEEKELKGKQLINVILSKWIDSIDSFLEMIVLHLPSPKTAQQYRTSHLYEGSSHDICYQSMKECDPKGPLMIYIVKMVPTTKKDRLFAFGRVFSGTVSAGKTIRFMGPTYKPGAKQDLIMTSIGEIAILQDKSVLVTDQITCGNIVGLVFTDRNLLGTGTISDYEGASCIRFTQYSMSPFIKIMVEPKNVSDLPKLIDGVKKLSKCDPLIVAAQEETGVHVIAGYDRSHLENSLRALKNDYTDCEIKESDIYFTYTETVSTLSQVCMTKSPNKHCRFYCTAEPLPELLCELIEKGEIGPRDDVKLRANRLSTEFDFDFDEAQKLWTFGPEGCGPNILVDVTKNYQHINELRNSCESSFQWVTKEGVLCEENMRGVQIKLVDVMTCADSIHRGGGQVIPAMRRVCYACELTSQPRLQEANYLNQITVPEELLGELYALLNRKRATILEENAILYTSLVQIKFYLPVAEFIDLDSSLLESCKISSCCYSHWETMPSDPLDPHSKAYEIVAQIRKRKGLKEAIPELSLFLDKL